MSYADLQIVAIALILSTSYGVFMFMYAEQPTSELQTQTGNYSNYSQPSSGDFFSNVNAAVKLNMENSEIFFVNSILFTPIVFLLAFIFLRYVRGTG